jgi:WS/DGAT/MGAT family acyltransferase
MNESLSPIESIMWRVGQDPTLRMTVGALVLLDRAPSTEALVAEFSSATKRAPRLGQRPEDPTLGRARPVWVDDPNLDMHHHVRSAAVATPGSLRQVLDLVALFEAIPFDPEHPPWDVTLIEGLENGRAALYLRTHHVVTDGLGGLRLADALFREVGWSRRRSEQPERDHASSESAASDRPRGTITIDLTKATRPIRRRVDAARDVEMLDVVVRGMQNALEVANSVSRQVLVTGGPLSPLFEEQSLMSRFEVFSVPRARLMSRTLGGSRNDLLVAGAARGLGLYHDRMGKPCGELRLATPAGYGRGREVGGGNWFVPARVEIPTGGAHPGSRFGIVAERLAQARSEPALRLSNTLAWAISRMPTRVVLPALQVQADSVDFAATTLPGLRRDRQICGARVEAMFPFGPRLGCPVNITALGNDDRLDVGVALDPAAITEPDTFLDSLKEAFESFDPDGAPAPSRGDPIEQVSR